jgi:hypothetical protein
MMTRAAFRRLIERLQAVSIEFGRHTLGPHGGRGRAGRLFPPPTRARIEAAEALQGWRFPPSYRTFLSLSNGWERYGGDITFIGADGAHTSRALRLIERRNIYLLWLELLHQSKIKPKGRYFELAAARREPLVMRALEKLKRRRWYFGTDHESVNYYFDPRRIRGGEPEVVIELPTVRALPRRSDFIVMLEREIASMEVRLDP